MGTGQGEVNEETVTSWEEQVCSQIRTEWTKGRQYVEDVDDLFDEIYSMFRGERPTKNYDWQSNVSINKAFQIVWTAVPYLVKKIFGANPIIGVRSFDQKGAWQREQILEFWHTLQGTKNSQHIPFFLTVVQILIRDTLNGAAFMKKTWNQKFETRNGKRIAVEDWPDNVVVSNKDIVFDWLLSPEQSIRQGRFVTHRNVEDLGALYDSGLYENLDQINLNQSLGHSEKSDDHSEATSKDGQDSPPESDIYTDVEKYERVGLWNVYREDGKWLPVLTRGGHEDKKVKSKYMIAVVAAGGTESKDVLIRWEPSPYEEINYIDSKCFMDIERFNSMGMIEPAKDTIVAMNDLYNNISDETNKNLNLPVIVNKHALWDWDTMIYAPNQRWMVGGDPSSAAFFVPPSSISRDAWQSYGLLDNEAQQTSVTNSMAGAGKEKTATTNVMNAQLSAGKLDFILKMVEVTFLIPSAQMDIRFAKKFAKQLTLDLIVTMGAHKEDKKPEPFSFSDWEEIYQYVPAAASVKIEYLKEKETTEDIQLLQILGSIKNPKAAKIMNRVLANIFRNRDMPVEADMLDEEYFEPESEEGKIKMLSDMMGASNEKGVPMSGQEKSVRRQTFKPKVM